MVIGEDTDILALLLHYCEVDSNSLLFQTSSKRWDIHHLSSMTPDIKDSILLNMHFLGCDTVSPRVFGMGKGKIMDTPRLRELCISLAPVFYSSTSSKEEIEEAGMKMMLALYKSKMPTLNKLRYKVFREKVDGAHAIKPVSCLTTFSQSVSSNSDMTGHLRSSLVWLESIWWFIGTYIHDRSSCVVKPTDAHTLWV